MFQGQVLSGDIEIEDETGSRRHIYDKTIEEEHEFRSPSMKRTAHKAAAGRRFGGTGRIYSNDA